MLKRWLLALAASMTLMGHAALAQQDYPSRPIRLLVPFAPGGGTDAAARVISKKLSENLGQSIIVDNKGGAGLRRGGRIGLMSDHSTGCTDTETGVC